jgi:hypothetical protein
MSLTAMRRPLARVAVLLATSLLAVAGFLLLRDADAIESVYFPKCPLYLLTGWHCAGCGATRALHALAHGDLAAAWSSNPLLVGGLPVLASVWGYRRLSAWRGKPPALLPAGWIWTILVVLIAFGVVRNVPIYPLTLLAPH